MSEFDVVDAFLFCFRSDLGLRRCCISLAALKAGTTFSETETGSLVRGLQLMRAACLRNAIAPKPRSGIVNLNKSGLFEGE
jgi:hypothetical protein